MNPLLSYAVKSLRKNKARTAVTITGVMMSAALIVAMAAFGTSLYRYLQEGYKEQHGDWHIGVCNGRQEDLENICIENGIGEPVMARSIGYADVETTDAAKHYLYLQGVGAEYYEHVPVYLTEGRIPQQEGEILLPESFRKAAAENWEIGSIIQLEVGLRLKDGVALWQHIPYGADAYGTSLEADTKENLQQLQVQRYQVTGFYSTQDSSGSVPGYEALTWWDKKAQDDGYNRFSVWFQISDVGNATFHKVYDEIRLEYGYSNVQIPINSELLSLYGMRMTDKRESVAAAAAVVILLLIVLTGSVMLIYNAFAISVGERTKQFGLLSSVGATGKQIRGCVLYEALFISAGGVFLGIFAGIAVVAAALRIIGETAAQLLGFSDLPHLYVWFPSVVLAAALAVATVFISAWIPAIRATKVTAIEAIRQNQEFLYSGQKKRVSRSLEKIFGF
ncbi:MAG: ABC transporter permease, partial [Acetatifactor sp.]|nr:ABC transporter permease [Acetatifactor sp.]